MVHRRWWQGACEFVLQIPELDESFWREAKLVEPDRTEQISLRVKRSVLDHFRAPGKGYQTRINRVLESYVRAQRGSG